MKKYVIGVDVGGTNIRAALINIDGDVELKVKELTGSEPLKVLLSLVDSLFAQQGNNIYGIGLAVAGIVDTRNGIVLRSPNIQKLTGLNLKNEFIDRYKKCIVIENDANAAAYGEKFSGSGRNFKDFVILTLGTGIGGGIVINNRLLSVASEIGHMSINANGLPCACGSIGCLEAYASASAISSTAISEIERGKESILKDLYSGNLYKITTEDIYNAALEGDSLSRMVLKEAGRNLGIGIANIINIFSPEAVILTGGLLGAWNIYIDSAIKEASKRTLKELYQKVKIIPSLLGDDAGVIGAARLVFEECKIDG